MAIAVLISSAAEAERCVAIGLDFASRLDKPVAFLCIEGSTEAKKSESKPDSKKGNRKQDKSGTESGQAEEPTVPAFPVTASYCQETREHISRQIATLSYGFVQTDVMEVPANLEDLTRWVSDHHQSSHFGHFEIDTLLIPTLRGSGLEHAREEKERLFETSRVETILLSLDQEVTGRLPLNNIGVTGPRQDDVLTASRFARRLSNVRVVRWNKEEADPETEAVLMAIQGKARQTRIDNVGAWNSLRKDADIPLSMVLNPADSLGDRFNSLIDDKFRNWFQAYQLSREDRVKLSDKLEAGATSSPEFILFMSVATFLACIGLIQDSAAVIIGAMLVAPLMTPLLGAGMAMIFGNKPLFVRAIKSILLGVGLAFTIGMLVGFVSLMVPDYLFGGSGLSLTNEMISRSQPNLLDPFIGLAAGLAGGFAIGRDGQIGTVAGVAIAAALVPPIGTAGLEAALAVYCTILEGDPTTLLRLLARDPGEILEARGLLNDAPKPTTYVQLVSAPLILFALNACATIIGAYTGLKMVGMHRTSRARQSRTWVVVFLVLLITVILLLMFLPAILF